MRLKPCLLVIVLLSYFLAACGTAPDVEIHYDPASLRFSGEQALATDSGKGLSLCSAG